MRWYVQFSNVGIQHGLCVCCKFLGRFKDFYLCVSAVCKAKLAHVLGPTAFETIFKYINNTKITCEFVWNVCSKHNEFIQLNEMQSK